jgi:hypothetical protein
MKARTNGEIASDLVPDEQARVRKTADDQKLRKIKSWTYSFTEKLKDAMQVLNEIDGLSTFAEGEMEGGMDVYFAGQHSYSEVMSNLETNLRNCIALAKDLEEGLS